MNMDIATAIAAAQASFALLKGAIDARDDAKAKAAIGEMASKLTDMQLSALSMSSQLLQSHAELKDLRLQLDQLNERERRRKGYVLREIRRGAYVYAHDPVEGDATPAHYVCQTCFDAGKVSVLQISPSGTVLMCLVDAKHNVHATAASPDPINYGSRLTRS